MTEDNTHAAKKETSILIVTETPCISGAEMILEHYINSSKIERFSILIGEKKKDVVRFFKETFPKNKLYTSPHVKKGLDPALESDKLSLLKAMKKLLYLLFLGKQKIFDKIFHQEKVDLVVGNNTSDIFYAPFAHAKGIPFIIFVYDIVSNSKRHKIIFKYFDRYIHLYIAASQSVKDSLIKNDIEAGKIQVVYNGISPAEDEKIHPAEREESIAFIGNLARRKNPLLFIKMFEVLNKKSLAKKGYIFYKNYEKRTHAQIERYISKHQLNIEMIQDASRDAIDAKLAMVKFFVLSSHKDPFPTVVLESLRLGIPVLGTLGSGGVEEMITHKKHGFLFDSEDENFSELSSWMEGISNEEYQCLCENALDRIKDFPASKKTSMLDDLLRSFIRDDRKYPA